MGKASSSKKVARAAKAAGRPGAKKSYAWPVAIGAVVVLGVVLVVLSFGGTSDAVAPRVGDHWHAAYGVYNCDAYTPPFPQEAQDQFGIHTHGEGLMHIHPFTSRVTGTRANLAAFFKDVGADVSDTTIKSESLGMDVKNGDKCGSSTGHVELWEWTTPADTSPKVVTKDITGYHPQDQSVWTLAFVAKGTKPTLPPAAANLQDPLAAEQGRAPAVGGDTTTSAPGGGSSTTVPAGGSTSTTVASGTSTTVAGSTSSSTAPPTTTAP
jgi:hypothetical protein